MKLTRRFAPLVAVVILGLAACETDSPMMTAEELNAFGTRYAAAWSSQNPDELASFYSGNGMLVVNDGTPSVGREAIAATAEAYMSAFPDMVVRMDSVVRMNDRVNFHWTWTGTNTGPEGTGASVHLTGYEQWTFNEEGLIQLSDGHYDQEEYERQMEVSDE
jgi:uncharacterized protein (TIGR02246 family)